MRPVAQQFQKYAFEPVSFDCLDLHQLGRDGEGGEGFEEDAPGEKDHVGGDRGQMGEEACSLRPPRAAI